MYAKIETERLIFTRLNQTKLRSEEYIHLRDATATRGWVQLVIKIKLQPFAMWVCLVDKSVLYLEDKNTRFLQNSGIYQMT
jgi:hypothetical protein